MKIAASPVMEADADLEDAVIQVAHRRARITPQELEGLVLLEELAGVELLDAVEERSGRWVGTSGAGGLVGCAARLPLGWASRFAGATTWLGRARIR
jgi:hypothetical protein